ncbi:MAG: hypothetical protein J6N81_10745 [Treponema sp.]|nr:hypothetical protein [Treponema sp.]
MTQKQCIVLIGAQHVGKTTLGKGLAEKLGVPFFDTDQMVTKTYGKHITVFSYERGSEGYNWAETEVSKTLVERFNDAKPIAAVIATGSGFHHDETGIAELRKIGTFYWIDGDLELGAQRILNEATTNESEKIPYLMTYGRFSNLYSYAVRDKIETLEDLRKSYMKISVPSREHYAKIADITVKPQDAPKEENIELLYNSIPLKSELK